MSKNKTHHRKFWQRCLTLVAGFAVIATSATTVDASDFMDVDISLINDDRVTTALINAEAFWEERIFGYRDDLPQAMVQRMHNLQLTASLGIIDGPGMTVAQAATTDSIIYGVAPPPNIPTQFGNQFGNTNGRRWEIAQEGAMQIDIEDVPFLTDSQLFNTVVHEMAHAMGFNPGVWAGNDLLTVDPTTDNNPFNDEDVQHYLGEYGLAEYQRLNQDMTLQFVPLESEGGPGTGGSHWEDAVDEFVNENGAAIMTGFVSPLSFLSSVTEAQWVDVGYATRFRRNRFGDVVIGGGNPGAFPKKWNRNPPISFLTAGGSASAVPEPSSMAILLGMGVMAAARRRRLA